METVENKYITVAYKLYTVEDGEKELFEETNAEHPFQFISGLGTTLESFENQITALSKGDKFDFTIPADEAYGAYDEQHVFDLPKNIFEIDGTTTTRIICRTARLIDVCNIFISSFLYFRAAKVRAFLLYPNKSKKKIT